MSYPLPDDAGIPSPDEVQAMYAPAPQPTPPVVQEASVTGLRGELAPAPANDLPHPDEVMSSFAPAAPEGPVTSTVSPASAPPQTVKAGVGESFGTSQSGFDQGKYAQVEQATKGVAGRIAKGQAAVQASFDPLKQGLSQAAQVEQQGVVKEIEAAQAKMLEQSRLEMDAAKSAAAFAEAEKAAFAKSQAEGQLAKADYQRSLAEWSAMSVNPGRLFQSAGKGGQFQMGVAAFVHDFLGAKGIKTSAMDTLNRAIDRDIDAQIQNIGKAGQVTQGFKTLWDMQRAQSQSDAEARLRMRGFALETAKHEAAASLGVMDSKLAGAKLQRAQAEIVKEQVKNTLAVEAQIQDGKNAVAQREVQLESAKLSASATVRSAKYSYDANMARIAADERGRVGKAPDSPDLLPDISKSGGGINKWRFKPGIDAEQKRETRTKLENTTKMVDALRELDDLQASTAAPPPGMSRQQFLSERQRRVTALQDTIVAAVIFDETGKVSTRGDVERAKSRIPAESWFTRGSNKSIIAQTIDGKISEMNNMLRVRTDELQPGDAGYGTATHAGGFALAEKAEAGGNKNPAPPSATQMTESRLGSPDVSKPVENFSAVQAKNPEAANAWNDYMASRGGLTDEDYVRRGALPDDIRRNALHAKLRQRGGWSGGVDPEFDPALPDKGFIDLYKLHQASLAGDLNARDRIKLIANTSEDLGIGSPYASPLVSLTPDQANLERTAEWVLSLPWSPPPKKEPE